MSQSIERMTNEELRAHLKQMSWQKDATEKEIYEAEVEMIRRDLDFPIGRGVL